jgi:hypothetical protein
MLQKSKTFVVNVLSSLIIFFLCDLHIAEQALKGYFLSCDHPFKDKKMQNYGASV